MVIRFICAGTRMPDWVEQGYREYARRLPRESTLTLIEIPLGRRGKGRAPGRAVAEEGSRMLKAVPADSLLVTLDMNGRSWTTEQLAKRLQGWLQDGRDLALLVGGPDGLADECLRRAHVSWSLSPLTLPHPLVRVVVAEQLYRAWSLLKNHPYHRA
jgi:23S rRNA (pseudouridine1915-N3)-methyltransferase